ncbi:MAG: hypothetical protein IT424_16045 [Pirellulales bacterium]|nr:hypothetical protein [Pirellulales bacterium]
MSDEVRLPDELAACEARLASLAIPAASIDRDALLYRTGWAAALESVAGAEAARLAEISLPAPRRAARPGAGRTRFNSATAACSLASAALAASLAVVATLLLRPPHIVEVAAQSPPPTARPLVHAAASPEPTRLTAAPHPVVRPSLNAAAGLIGLRRQSLAGSLGEFADSSSATADADATPPKTLRDLMGELLPQDAARSAHLWPWSRRAPGETI